MMTIASSESYNGYYVPAGPVCSHVDSSPTGVLMTHAEQHGGLS